MNTNPHTNPHLHPVSGLVPSLHDAPEFPDDFDSDAVPRFPLIVLEVSPSHGREAYLSPYTVTMDGEPIPVARWPQHEHPEDQAGPDDHPANNPSDGSDPTTTQPSTTVREHAFAVALDAASRKIAARGWAAARVNAVDSDGNRWPMIIGANGERLDLNASTVLPRSRRHWVPIAAAALAVVLSAVTVGTVLATRTPTAAPAPSAPVASPASRPTAVPAEYPVLPPVGASTHARWAFGPLAAADSFVQAPSGEVLVRTAQQLALLDPDSGTPAWISNVADSTTGPWTTTVGGQTAVVTGTSVNTTVTWRPLTNLDQAHVVPINAGSTMTPLPGGLLFTSPDQRVGLLAADGTLTTRLLPAGTEPVGIDGLAVLATNGRQLWRLDRDQPQTPNPITLQPPGAGARPGTAAVWRAGRLLTFWTLPGTNANGTARNVAALHTAAGRLVRVIPVQAQPAALDQVKNPDLRYTLLSDGTVVDHTTATLIPAAPAWQGTILIGGALYGRSGEQPGRYDLTTKKTTTSPAGSAANPVGQLGPDLLAEADRSDGPGLYRLQPGR